MRGVVKGVGEYHQRAGRPNGETGGRLSTFKASRSDKLRWQIDLLVIYGRTTGRVERMHGLRAEPDNVFGKRVGMQNGDSTDRVDSTASGRLLDLKVVDHWTRL
jgi:hypothetical protein